MKQKVVSEKTRFLSFRDVETITGLSRSTIYREMKKGSFPRARLIAARKVAFLQAELENWIQARQIAL